KFGWFESGLRSLLLPLFYLTGILVAVWAAKFVLRVLSLSKGVDQLLNTSMTRTMRLESRLNLQDPSVFGQAASLMGLLLLGALFWHFWPFILAFGSSNISTLPAQRFLPLQPTGHPRLAAPQYHNLLMLLLY